MTFLQPLFHIRKGKNVMNRLEVGKIVNTHGLKGEVKIVPWTDYPEVFEEIEEIYLPDGRSFKVKGVKYQKNNIIVKLEGINYIDEAEKLKGKVITAEREFLGELEEGVYYVADLIGLSVVTEDGETIGKISDVLRTGANDVYEVKREGAKDLLIPVIESVVKDVDIEGGKVVVHLMEGLLDL